MMPTVPWWNFQIAFCQGFINLLQNASFQVAVNSTKALEVMISQSDDEAIILLRDHGIGLPEDEGQISEPFFTTKPKGTGLGVFVARAVLDGAGGGLAFERDMTTILKYGYGYLQRKSGTTMLNKTNINQRPRLLVVDDDDAFREAMELEFSDRGYRVFAAPTIGLRSGLAAVHRPAYAVVDLRLGGERGLEVLKDLVERHPNIRAIVLTGYGSIATAIEAVKLGAHHYLTKPCEPDAIEEAFNRGPGDPNVSVPEKPCRWRAMSASILSTSWLPPAETYRKPRGAWGFIAKVSNVNSASIPRVDSWPSVQKKVRYRATESSLDDHPWFRLAAIATIATPAFAGDVDAFRPAASLANGFGALQVEAPNLVGYGPIGSMNFNVAENLLVTQTAIGNIERTVDSTSVFSLYGGYVLERVARFDVFVPVYGYQGVNPLSTSTIDAFNGPALGDIRIQSLIPIYENDTDTIAVSVLPRLGPDGLVKGPAGAGMRADLQPRLVEPFPKDLVTSRTSE